MLLIGIALEYVAMAMDHVHGRYNNHVPIGLSILASCMYDFHAGVTFVVV